MKIFIYVLMVLSFGLIIYNTTFLNFDALFSGDSAAAMVGILASMCVILLMLILLVSKAIEKKAK